MYTNRILATSGVVLILLTAGVAVAVRVFSVPARGTAMESSSTGGSRGIGRSTWSGSPPWC